MAAPPNGPIEVVFCFDTTGSMNGVIESVKSRVTELTRRLLADIGGIRIGILAHGDYGDEPYMLQQLDLTSDGDTLTNFIGSVRKTGGSDSAECYELALHEVRTNFSWSPGSRKRLIIIGDDVPHAVDSDRNKRKLDWRKETELLRDELHMVIYSVQAGGSSSSSWFWNGMADITGGKFVEMSHFSDIFDLLMAICYLEHGVEFFEAFGEEVRSRESGTRTSAMLNRLRDAPEAAPARSDEPASTPARTPSPPSRRRRVAGSRLHATKRTRTMKAKAVARRATTRARPRRESEPFNAAAVVVTRPWSAWEVLAAPSAPNDATAAKWRRFGAGVVRSHLSVPTAPKTRVLVELAVSHDGHTTTPLYSRLLCDGAKNAVPALLRGNSVLKWHLHQAVSRQLCVLLRFAGVESDGQTLRRQRLDLRKSNSYAWNSGRVVCAQREVLSSPAPRARQMEKFLRSLRSPMRT